MELSVTSLKGTFTASLQAHMLDNIASDKPAFQWSELKEKWPHLRQIHFENVSRRCYIDVMIGSGSTGVKGNSWCQPNDPIARSTNLGWVCFGPTLVEDYRVNNRIE